MLKQDPDCAAGDYYEAFSYAYPSIDFAINCIILVSNADSGTGVNMMGMRMSAKTQM